jgi:C-terminal processing protease CtpA/Prc
MNRLRWTAILFATVRLAAQTNLSFESGAIGQVPPGWFFGSSVSGVAYSVALVNQGCVQGLQCALLTGPASAPSGSFGDLAQEVLASRYLSQHIKFTAAVQVAPGSSAEIWLRVDHNDGTYDLQDSPVITSTGWAYYSLEANVTEESVDFYFGIFILGAGRAWADDASIQVTGTVTEPTAQPPSPLSPVGLANLTAFAKLVGEVRHFHPSDQVTQVDWNSFVIEALPAIEAAATPADLANQLQAAFAPVAPTVRVFTGSPPPLPVELKPASVSGLQITRWYNYGVYTGPQSSGYQSYRITQPTTGNHLPAGFQDPAQPYLADLGNGVWAMVPLSLYVNAEGTMPQGTYQTPATYFVWSAADRTTRLAGVILAWEIPQNFYPYFDTVQTDWPAALTSALTSAATDTGAADYTATLQRLGAALKDGHVTVVGGPVLSALPLIWDWVENQLIVTYVWDGQGQGIAAGDRVISIDGTPVEDAIAAEEQLVSAATPQRLLYRALMGLSSCNGATMQLVVEPYSSRRTTRTEQFSCATPQPWTAPRGDPVQQLQPGIYYVDINQVTAGEWEQALPDLAAAEGIVFDLRGYPQTQAYLDNLSARPLASERFLTPEPSQPDEVNLTFDESGEWALPPTAPDLSARRVFLTDASAISQAETVMGIVKYYGLAQIVGGPTAGTNGDINYIYLPAGFSMIFTGLKVLMQDGSQFEGIGIQPDVPVRRTRAGIAMGIDEVLSRGIEIVNGQRVPKHF